MKYKSLLLACFCFSGLFCKAAAINYSAWMEDRVNDYALLSSISMPGTHDSGTYGITNFVYKLVAQTQRASIQQQLMMGIRVLDIRCARSAANGGTFKVVHSSVDCNILFDSVLDDCFNFLNEHPGEFIVLMIKHEGENDDESAPSFQAIFDSYTQKYGADKFWLKNQMPAVGDVRGKIVITNREEISEGIRINWLNNCVFNSNQGVPFHIQDCYNMSFDNKVSAIELAMNNALNEPAALWFINLTSGYDTLPCPENRAKDINPVVRNYLNSVGSGRIGTILMDFAGEYGSDVAISNIISRNQK